MSTLAEAAFMVHVVIVNCMPNSGILFSGKDYGFSTNEAGSFDRTITVTRDHLVGPLFSPHGPLYVPGHLGYFFINKESSDVRYSCTDDRPL